MIKKLCDAIGGFKKIDGVAGWGSVDNDKIEPLVVVKFIQLFHRHVFVGTRHRISDVSKEIVGENVLGLFFAGRVGANKPIECCRCIEHDGPQFALCCDVNLLWFVADRAIGVESHGIRKSASWIDRDDTHSTSSLCGFKCERRSGCGLSNATGANANDHCLLFKESCERRHVSSSLSASMSTERAFDNVSSSAGPGSVVNTYGV